MKKILKFLVAWTVLATVNVRVVHVKQVNLIGVQDRPSWKGINPYGMVYVPSGTLHIGPSDQDVSNTFIQRSKTISIQGFYMDDTEITNNEYRQFVYWVRDSLAHDLLEHTYEDDLGNEYIDWEYEIDWASEELEDLFYQGDDKFAGKKELDISQLVYEYQWYDWQSCCS